MNGCRVCKYGDKDASDFPCSECYFEGGVFTRFLPVGSDQEWKIVLVTAKGKETS